MINTTNTKAKGERSEGIILAALLKQGFSVSLPFGNNQRYDLVVDDGTQLLRAQCKTGRYFDGCVCFAVSSKNGFTSVRRSYHGDIDIFLVYCPELDKVYRIPVEVTPKNEMRLRVDALKPTAPTSTIKWAKDFEIS